MKQSFQAYFSKSSPFRSLHYGWFLLLIMACNGNGVNGAEDIIVRYRQYTLSRAEIDYFIPDGVTQADSILFAERYIEEWIKGHAISEHARSRIVGLKESLGYKLKEYEKDLINHAFATYLAEQNSDVLKTTDEEVRFYYNQNPEKFISDTYYYQYLFVRTTSYANQQVVPLMRSNDPERLEELRDWALDNALDYRLDSSYVREPELERISEGFYYGNIRRVSKSTSYPFQLRKDGESYYNYFRLIDEVEPGERLPLRICADQIRNILINQKKNDLIEREEAALVEQARAAKKIVRLKE